MDTDDGGTCMTQGINSTSHGAWRSALDAALRGADERRVMTRHYADGLTLDALQPHSTRDRGHPGQGDLRRGSHAESEAWLIGQIWQVDGNADRLEVLKAEMAAGTQAWQLQQSCPQDSELASTISAIGSQAAIDLCGDADFATRVFTHNSETCVNANIDPFATALSTGKPVDEKALLSTVEPLMDTVLGNTLGHRVVACHGARYHASGASEALELALMFSTFVAWLRAFDSASVSIEDCARLTVMRPAVGRDLVLNVAKLRALRAGLAAICTHCGDADAARHVRLHAQPATREFSRTAPWVNTLRTTAATVAAALGGAQTVFTRTHDDTDSIESRRLARNTQLILREESGLHQVQDPCGGADQFEAMTDQLLQRAWDRFTQLESDGGIATAIGDGTVTATLRTHADELLGAVRHRRQVLTGVNLYPDPEGARNIEQSSTSSGPIACAPITLSDPFDGLRARVASPAPTVHLSSLSSTAATGHRVAFCQNLLAAGGLVGTTDDSEGARVVILCGGDGDYTAEVAERIRGLLQSGATRVYLAGTLEDAAAPLLASGAHSVIRAGLDAVDFLEDLHRHLGVS